jgi:hypothetical protein
VGLIDPKGFALGAARGKSNDRSSLKLNHDWAHELLQYLSSSNTIRNMSILFKTNVKNQAKMHLQLFCFSGISDTISFSLSVDEMCTIKD